MVIDSGCMSLGALCWQKGSRKSQGVFAGGCVVSCRQKKKNMGKKQKKRNFEKKRKKNSEKKKKNCFEQNIKKKKFFFKNPHAEKKKHFLEKKTLKSFF